MLLKLFSINIILIFIINVVKLLSAQQSIGNFHSATFENSDLYDEESDKVVETNYKKNNDDPNFMEHSEEMDEKGFLKFDNEKSSQEEKDYRWIPKTVPEYSAEKSETQFSKREMINSSDLISNQNTINNKDQLKNTSIENSFKMVSEESLKDDQEKSITGENSFKIIKESNSRLNDETTSNEEETLEQEIKPPNVIFILADDLGWNDVSFHGSDQIMTPNIDLLAYQGVILDQYYTDSLGTPSRSALFTGKYPMRLGTQGSSITATEDRGLPISEKLLPSYLKDLGYSTHLVGKWNLGKSRKQYLPTNRGFDSFFGFLDGSVDYFTYSHAEEVNGIDFSGLDLYNNSNPMENMNGHLTDLLTNAAIDIIRGHNNTLPLYLHINHAAPHSGGAMVNLQPLIDHIHRNEHIAHSSRRMYAALVTHLDESVGKIFAALAESNLLDNSIFIFASDNGAVPSGETRNCGSNFPLRGMKNSPLEGGIRSPAFVWNKKLKGKIFNELFHVTDWVPTLIKAIDSGMRLATSDGINQWPGLTADTKGNRTELLLTVDDISGWAAFREGDYKLIVGEIDLAIYEIDDIYRVYSELRFEAPSYRDELKRCTVFDVMQKHLEIEINIDELLQKRENLSLHLRNNDSDRKSSHCIPTGEKGCLYNIREDFSEINDLWDSAQAIAQRMTLRLRTLWAEMKPRAVSEPDIRSNPFLSNYSWCPWLDDDEDLPELLVVPRKFPLHITAGEIQFIIDSQVNSFMDKIFGLVNSMRESFSNTVGSLFSI